MKEERNWGARTLLITPLPASKTGTETPSDSNLLKNRNVKSSPHLPQTLHPPAIHPVNSQSVSINAPLPTTSTPNSPKPRNTPQISSIVATSDGKPAITPSEHPFKKPTIKRQAYLGFLPSSHNLLNPSFARGQERLTPHIVWQKKYMEE